jgi:uncharacterized membrane protein HdeD (DUF308 family)
MTQNTPGEETTAPDQQDVSTVETSVDASTPPAGGDAVEETVSQEEENSVEEENPLEETPAEQETAAEDVPQAEVVAVSDDGVSSEQNSKDDDTSPAKEDVESSPPEPVAVSPSKAETIGLIQQSTTWSIVLGALMMVLGIAAISLPLVTSLALTLWIGWLLVGNSIIKLVYAIQTRQQGSFWLKLLLAGLYLVAGVVLILNPLEAVLTLTLLLGSFLVAEGVVELWLAIQMRSRSSWLWLLLNALLTLALGVFIWAEWPLDAPWVIGLLVGISFIASGLSRIMLSIAVRSTVRQIAEAV